jgi:AcrR family transcriptional regulator
VLGAGKPRGPYVKTEKRRREILEAALEVFASGGYRSGSIRDVAAKVGMSEAGLLHHFPNKSALLTAVLDQRDTVASGLVPLGDDAGIDTLIGLAELAEYNMTVPGLVELYCVLSAEATSPAHPAHDFFVQRYEWARSGIGRSLTRMGERGQLRDGIDPEVSARNILALMDGLQVQWLLDRDSVDMPTEIRAYIRSLTTMDF